MRIFALDDSEAVLAAIRATFVTDDLTTGTLWSQISRPLLKSKGEPAVLICDLNMPGMDGAEFCRIVREYCPSTNIVIFSSNLQGHSEAELASLADALLLKSAGLQALREVVERLAGAAPLASPSEPSTLADFVALAKTLPRKEFTKRVGGPVLLFDPFSMAHEGSGVATSLEIAPADPSRTVEAMVATLKGSESLVLGRSSKSDIVLPLGRVSRAHARFDTSPAGVLVRDLGSRFGTWVGGVRLTPQRPHSIRNGDVIRIAGLYSLFHTCEGFFEAAKALAR